MQIIGPAIFTVCLHWIIRYAVRAELKRIGFEPLPPRKLTIEEWQQVDALDKAGKTYKAVSLLKQFQRATR